jgi:hypothetical protein
MVRSRRNRCRDGSSPPVLSAVLSAAGIRATSLIEQGRRGGTSRRRGGPVRRRGRRPVGPRLPGAMCGRRRRHSARRRSRGNRAARTLRRADPSRRGCRRLAPSGCLTATSRGAAPSGSQREPHRHAPDHRRCVAGYSRAMEGAPDQWGFGAIARVATQHQIPLDTTFHMSTPVRL